MHTAWAVDVLYDLETDIPEAVPHSFHVNLYLVYADLTRIISDILVGNQIYFFFFNLNKLQIRKQLKTPTKLSIWLHF